MVAKGALYIGWLAVVLSLIIGSDGPGAGVALLIGGILIGAASLANVARAFDFKGNPRFLNGIVGAIAVIWVVAGIVLIAG